MHGGAKGAGAPTGNGNARKHGLTTATARAERRHLAALIRASERLMREMG